MSRRILIIFFAALALLIGHEDAFAQRSSRTVRQEKRENAKKIERTQSKIKDNLADTKRQAAKLQTVEANILKSDNQIKTLTHRADSITKRVKVLTDSVETIQSRVDNLQESYASSLRTIRRQRQVASNISFIFSSRSFSEARKRIRYLRELGRWETEKARELKATSTLLEKKREELDSIKASLARDIASLESEKLSLERQRLEADVIISRLRKQGKQLEKVLSEQQKQAQILDKELDRIIEAEAKKAAEEARKKAIEEEKRKAAQEAKRKADEEAKQKAAEDAKKKADSDKKKSSKKDKKKPTKESKKKDTPEPTTPAPASQPQPQIEPIQPEPTEVSPSGDDFASAKGKLRMPVNASAIIVSDFGRHAHEALSKVEVQNNGIDIETVQGASAVAVYPGVVSMVIVMEGYHNVVLIRHGEYLTVYAGISKLDVRKGQSVKAGQSLGTIYSDPADDNRTRLHFEVRHEKDKLNPADWLR
ncbi:MAG: peptidoglycan DD-metalloendopeptidase family protein [Muribaculaceae bacterium]|nr:peptidoglycan DD-metalloendopeptidase family protein [Muribaculaceae bacterium]